jgi:hypothetical protein
VDSLHLLDLVKDTNTENLALDWDRYADTETSQRALDKKLKVSVSGARGAMKRMAMMHLHTCAQSPLQVLTQHPLNLLVHAVPDAGMLYTDCGAWLYHALQHVQHACMLPRMLTTTIITC